MTPMTIGRRTLAAALLAGCVPPPDAPLQGAPGLPPPPVPLDQAALAAGNAVFAAIAAGGGRQTVVIDPLVNGVTGEQTASTRALASRLTDLARERYPQIAIAPFTAATLAAAPLVMVGTFTPVNAANQVVGLREAYRFCLVMADLKSGTTLAKSVVRATPQGINATPTRSFADSPAWTEDATVKGYLDTCQATRVGGPIPPVYLNGILTAAMLSEAMDAYDNGRYAQALQIYTAARATPAGEQLRAYNGLYLSHARLGQRDQAASAFGDVVDYGLRNRSLAVKLLFRPASTALTSEPLGPGTYEMWLRQIAARTASANACLQVTGHTSASGSAALNDRLSVLRAEYVKQRLEQEAPALKGRLLAAGVGAQEALVGTGADDATDVLDRRVEFKVMQAC
jgi:outer membrane protein OmpA-like peptidoglycan-associated protein